MTIGFDVSDLCTNRADGTTRYTRELYNLMPTLDEAINWQWYAPCESKEKVSHKNGKWIASPFPKYWTQLRLPFDLHKHKPDVLFMPIQQLPFIRPRHSKTVAVVHDLAFHIYPEQFTRKDWMLQHIFTATACREADHIIAVSQATADDIKKYYGRGKNVHVVHHGLDRKQFRLPTSEEKTASLQSLQKQFPKLKKPYILYVGQIQPRKNIVRLVEAFEVLKKEGSDLQLVIAGGHGWKQQEIFKKIKHSTAKDSIIVTGRVEDTTLRELYWHAEVFTLVSLYEGFGMPILEAMACGAPVVTSNVSSMPEIAGDAAVIVDPLSTKSIAQGIQQAIQHSGSLQEKGITQAQAFTWDKTAQKTLKILQDLKLS